MTTSVEISETDWAWLAGLIEGDGYAGIYMVRHKNRRFENKRPVIAVELCDKILLDRCKRLCGGNMRPMKQPGDSGGLARYTKVEWIWQVSHRKALTVARGIRPYIYGPKDQIIEDIIDFYEKGVD